ncbi:MAG: lytic murein transglycosylase B [Gammaproteobacteria bacterium]|nr:lytic murein transglycosylase B [Gammaproteobacteria bacterium]
MTGDNKIHAKIHACVFGALLACLPGNSSALNIGDYPELEDLIQTMVEEDGYPEDELRALIESAAINEKTLELMDRQWEAVPWHKYRDLFINYRRIRNGVEFWNEHEATLKKAEAEYGVPASVIVSIIGVETHYGKRKGNSNVLNSLVSLTAAYPRRSKYFKKELRVFLNLARRESIEAGSVYGSYAGAIGIPQFMPSSYENHSVDFNGNGIRDLVNEVEDAVGSVANYLVNHGWKAGQAIYSDVQGSLPESALALVRKSAKPQQTVESLVMSGIEFNSEQASQKAALVKLTLENDEYRHIVAFNNLYVITRYNNSINYSMAVTELAEEIEQRR